MANIFKPTFRDATRSQAKASVVIGGLSGRGKSGLALTMGFVLADGDWEAVAALDTENRSLDLFEGIASHMGIPFKPFKKFDLLRTHGYRPTHYIAGKEAAIEMGAKVYIQDSITHAWIGQGGVLDLVNKKESANSSLNKYSAWGEAEVSNEKNSIYEMIRDPGIHMISTVRMKEKHDLKDGKVVSLGEQQIQMPDLKYEPDLVLQMESPGNTRGQAPKATIIKSRYAIFEEGETYEFTEQLLKDFKGYLAEGADPAVIQERQREEFISEVKYILDNSKSKQTVYHIFKEELGYKDIPLDELPLEAVRKVLSHLML